MLPEQFWTFNQFTKLTCYGKKWVKCFNSMYNLFILMHLYHQPIYIERVAEFNFLGLTLDENLSWKSHINKSSNRISTSMETKPFYLNTNQNALVLSYLNFGILAWAFNVLDSQSCRKRLWECWVAASIMHIQNQFSRNLKTSRIKIIWQI